MSDRKIIGGEALLRWKHPRKGLLIPKDFLSIAEASEVMVNINEWVIQTACHFSRQLRQKGSHLKIAINLSGKDLKEANTLQMLNKALVCNSLEGNHIEIDVAEDKILQNSTSIITMLKDMKKMNLKIALDDFGAGHSSLSDLTSFEADRIKIDHSFIKKCANKNAIKAIIALGHSLDMKIIAEGVETEDEFQFLKSLGCDECQGYLFSPPVSKENFLTLLEQDIL